MQIRRATVEDTAAISSTLEVALRDDPFVEWLVRSGPAHDRARRRYLEIMIARIALPRGLVYVAEEDDGAVIGAALWAPPGTFELSASETLRMLPAMIDVVGFGRLSQVSSILDAIDAARPPEPRWLLTLAGVLPGARRRGVGSALLCPVLDRCDDEGTRIVLETAREENVRFYEQLGFRVHADRRLGLDGPHSWTMVREPLRARARVP